MEQILNTPSVSAASGLNLNHRLFGIWQYLYYLQNSLAFVSRKGRISLYFLFRYETADFFFFNRKHI